MLNSQLHNFLEFIRQQGVVGLAVAFILGGAVQKVVSSAVQDLVNPIIGLLIGKNIGSLSEIVVKINESEVKIGHFLTVFIDFLVIALVVYLLVKVARINRLDKPKQP